MTSTLYFMVAAAPFWMLIHSREYEQCRMKLEGVKMTMAKAYVRYYNPLEMWKKKEESLGSNNICKTEPSLKHYYEDNLFVEIIKWYEIPTQSLRVNAKCAFKMNLILLFNFHKLSSHPKHTHLSFYRNNNACHHQHENVKMRKKNLWKKRRQFFLF